MKMVAEKNYIDELIEPIRNNTNSITKLLEITKGNCNCKFSFIKVNTPYEKITDDLCVSECGYFCLVEDFNSESKSLLFLKELEPSVAPSAYSQEAVEIFWRATETYRKSIQHSLMIHLNISVDRNDLTAEEVAEQLINNGSITIDDLVLAEFND